MSRITAEGMCSVTELTHGELFAGIGGFGMGFDRAGMKTIWHVEIDKDCQNVLRRHFPECDLFGDVCECGSHNLKSVDVISFGSPCQDLSIAGKRNGLAGERSGLFHEAIRIIRELEPAISIWENVPGSLSSSKGNDFRIVLSEMLGADVPMPRSGRWANAGVVRSGETEVAWRILDAQHFGVPQRRRRVFVVRCVGDRSASEILFERTGSTGDTEKGGKAGEGTPAATLRGFGHGWQGQHNDTNAVMVAETYRMTAFGEYSDDEKASALKTRDYKDATDLVVPLVGVRRLTPTEAERLQGFPDSWTDGQADTTRYRQLGNAVAVPVVHWIGRRIYESINQTGN